VTILDKEYQVACPPEQQAELLLSARHLDEQMRAIRDGQGHRPRAHRRHGRPEHQPRTAARHAMVVAATNPESTDAPATATAGAVADLNAKLDEALHQLRQIEIG
jgi:cell division protein ZapA